MRNSLASMISMALVATVALAPESYGQMPELRRSSPNAPLNWNIEHITGGVYHATANTAGTAFLVTPEGIILADPLSPEFAGWLKGEFEARFSVPVRYVVYSHYHWDHGSGGGVFADTAQFVG